MPDLPGEESFSVLVPCPHPDCEDGEVEVCVGTHPGTWDEPPSEILRPAACPVCEGSAWLCVVLADDD